MNYEASYWPLLILAIVLVATLIYFIPAIVAFRRAHRNRWVILLVNVAFGTTILGWFAALIWAMNKIDDPLPQTNKRRGSTR